MSPEPVVPAAPGLPLPLTGETRLFAILGDPIAQAGSPALFNAEFRRRSVPCVLVPMRVPPADLETAFKGLWTVANLDGLVLTVPHKIDVLRLVDELGPTARRMGAVNAVRRLPDGRLLGENFDGVGFVVGLHGRGFSNAGRSILIVGCGGAGTAIAFAVAEQRPDALHLFDVDPLRASDLARRIREAHPDLPIHAGDRDPTGMDMVVNCTSLGMKSGDALPVEVDRMDSRTVAVDIVLKPEVTPFLARAAALGCATHSGSHMLAAQVGAICDFFGLNSISIADGIRDT